MAASAMAKTAARSFLKQQFITHEEGEAKPLFSDEEIAQIETMSDADLEAYVSHLDTKVAEIEFRKRMRRTARENRELRQFETEDANMLKTAKSNEKVIIDRVPPKFRRDMIAAEIEE